MGQSSGFPDSKIVRHPGRGIQQDSSVELTLEKGKLIIVSSQRLKFTLKQLLSGVGQDNLHQEIRTGPPIGKNYGRA